MMTKLIVIITCAVVLTVHWGSFKDKVNLSKMLKITSNIMEEVKE